jgi:hypothetical protein
MFVNDGSTLGALLVKGGKVWLKEGNEFVVDGPKPGCRTEFGGSTVPG